ncbi:MAG: helix-turn-helix domain-containing protein [Elusimicrobia bacterium]|nr:helix-turn-helix domain-containing protein [Elusimicrobiota bacterium]MBK7575784.1 helix-turn-helix domain-containing protein [Elusimicrobiota bacterium]MBK8127298.1 helix-turn-helix domain-containing protein [Elusimicrobiota bacterium]MBK9058130.1 helix-turn-helix domain-containing protein [Elusimicrobiota bacterium]MBK9429648.1 helix-turn-helix domain-containing protein [Elusimicrobiota bacterium]
MRSLPLPQRQRKAGFKKRGAKPNMRYWKNYNDWKIVTLIDQGHSPKEVARDLSISVWTVYRANKRFVPRGNAPKTANQKVCKNCGAHVEFN